jgi:signal transduction histidine kinase
MTTAEIINGSKRRCDQIGLDPNVLPVYQDVLSSEQLESRVASYQDIIEVGDFFIDKFLSSAEGSPVLILLTDEDGYVLALRGDPTIQGAVQKLGIALGTRFTEEVGTNSIALALRYGKPIRLAGQDHYHRVLFGLACCSAPFGLTHGSHRGGTLSLMTEVQFTHPHMLALLCTLVDAIERELLLRQRNTQLHILNQVLMETNFFGVVVTDAEGTVLELNELSREWLSADCGDNVFELEPVGSYFRCVAEEREGFVGVELSLGADKAMRFFQLDAIPIFDAAYGLIRMFGLLRDVTERRKTEEMLRHTEKLVVAGQLAVGIAHEVRNPLTTVKGLIQFSNQKTPVPQYDLIMSELDRMNLIVSEFLLLGKPQAVAFQEASSMSVLREVVSVFGIQASMNGVSIDVTGEGEGRILCDPNQLKQLFLNVLKNATEALPFGGVIEIRFGTEGRFQHIRFTDNGIGMSEEVLRQVGEPFYSTKQDGNGLGIMIVKKIVEGHGGRIAFESRPREGTSVDIYFPLLPKEDRR